MIDQKQTIELIKRAQNGDEEAKNILIEENTPLVKCVIKHYKMKGIEYDDLFQLGCVGFSKAINKFDINYQVKFSTYAVPMILGEVKRYLRDEGYIKVSRSTKHLASEIKKYIEAYHHDNGISPHLDKIAEKFNMDIQDIVFALDATRLPISIYDNADDEDNLSLAEKIANESENMDTTLEKITLKNLINKLPPKERKIIILRYFKDRTQMEIAEELGVSQVQVSRIENKILKELKSSFL